MQQEEARSAISGFRLRDMRPGCTVDILLQQSGQINGDRGILLGAQYKDDVFQEAAVLVAGMPAAVWC
jgi:hypothetical protein